MAVWILEQTASQRFPYRLRIEGMEGPRVDLATGDGSAVVLWVQDRWPSVGRNVFCMRELGDPPEVVAELERVPVRSVKQFGRRLTVILDRSRNKRCDFLLLTRAYKSRPGETYEQVFWHTQQFLTKHRPGAKLSVTAGRDQLTVIIDARERYPWRFPRCVVQREQLPAGDYALAADGAGGAEEESRLLAVVERKTFENMLGEFGMLSAFHQRLNELELYANAAVVVEAHYSDFLNPKKQAFYAPSFCARALAEIAARHPALPLVFAGNRKLASVWAASFFGAVHKCHTERGNQGPSGLA